MSGVIEWFELLLITIVEIYFCREILVMTLFTPTLICFLLGQLGVGGGALTVTVPLNITKTGITINLNITEAEGSRVPPIKVTAITYVHQKWQKGGGETSPK